MILLYTLLLLLLGVLRFLTHLRARVLERKFVRLAGVVDQLIRQMDTKPGNSGKSEAGLSAKRAFLLGQMVHQRDHVEAKHFAWQKWCECLTRWTGKVREWKGMKLPYTLGVLDVSMLFYAIDYLGVGEYLNAHNVIHTVSSLFVQ